MKLIIHVPYKDEWILCRLESPLEQPLLLP
jgi:hypothetical protein